MLFRSELQIRMKELQAIPLTDDNRKHVSEELRELSKLVIQFESFKPHKFIGYHETSDLLLTTNRDYREITEEQIENGQLIAFPGGVRVKTADLNSIRDSYLSSNVIYNS